MIISLRQWVRTLLRSGILKTRLKSFPVATLYKCSACEPDTRSYGEENCATLADRHLRKNHNESSLHVLLDCPAVCDDSGWACGSWGLLAVLLGVEDIKAEMLVKLSLPQATRLNGGNSQPRTDEGKLPASLTCEGRQRFRCLI